MDVSTNIIPAEVLHVLMVLRATDSAFLHVFDWFSTGPFLCFVAFGATDNAFLHEFGFQLPPSLLHRCLLYNDCQFSVCGRGYRASCPPQCTWQTCSHSVPQMLSHQPHLSHYDSNSLWLFPSRCIFLNKYASSDFTIMMILFIFRLK